MKKIILAIALFAVLACKHERSTPLSHQAQKNDTVRTTAIYILGSTREIHVDYCFRITKDTLAFSTIDSTGDQMVAQKKWVRDTSYFVPVQDTVKENGRAMLDSLGHPKMRITFYQLPNRYILQDFNKAF